MAITIEQRETNNVSRLLMYDMLTTTAKEVNRIVEINKNSNIWTVARSVIISIRNTFNRILENADGDVRINILPAHAMMGEWINKSEGHKFITIKWVYV